jgi:hypothetical protein
MVPAESKSEEVLKLIDFSALSATYIKSRTLKSNSQISLLVISIILYNIQDDEYLNLSNIKICKKPENHK